MSKSNIPEIIMWGVYAIITGVCLVGCAVSGSNRLGYGIGVGVVVAVLLTALVGALAVGIHKLFVRFGPNRFFEDRKIPELLVEGLVLLGMLVGMVLVRVSYPWNVVGDAVYEGAQIKMTADDVLSGHGGHDLFVRLVKLSLLLLGNQPKAPVVLQLVLLIGAAVALYFGVRRQAGRISALLAVTFLGFSPYMIEQTCKLTSFLLVLMFFGVALICISGISRGMRRNEDVAERVLSVLCYVTSGLLIGVCCYLDVAGIVLLVVMTGTICSVDDDSGDGGILRNPVIVFGTVLVFVIFMFVLMHGSLENMSNQLALYVPGQFKIPTTVEFEGVLWESILFSGMLVFGAFSFLFSRCMGRRRMWLFSIILLAGMQCFGISAIEYFDGYVLLYLLCVVLAGCGMTDVIPKTEDAKENFGMAVVDMNEPEKDLAQQESVQEIEFIENPLPLPKKHVKKVMDYDIQVADDDDFDI